jgi:hypothetical protein
MPKRNDYVEMYHFSKDYIGKTVRECIDAFAAKRKIGTSRAGIVFWSIVDDGLITAMQLANGYEYILEVKN